MTGKEFDIEAFVRGMVWHDVGKPFFLGTPRHTWLGYWLLIQADYTDEALVALTHGGSNKDRLNKKLSPYFASQPKPLPAILLLTNPLDRISASAYSLLGRLIPTEEFNKENPLFHSWQNPFSRLPRTHASFQGIGDNHDNHFIVRQDRSSLEQQDEKDDEGPLRRDMQLDKPLWEQFIASSSQAPCPVSRRQLDKPLWEQLIAALPKDWKDPKPSDVRKKVSTQEAMTTKPAGVNGRELIQILEPFQRRYPERTYPPANDTSLSEHTRLSGALAFVLYRNLEQNQSPWLSYKIKCVQNKVNLVRQTKTESIDTCLQTEGSQKDVKAWNEARRVACAHLDARLVRVALEGHRELFESAVRVDDLLGARDLTQRFLDAFEHELAKVLGVPGLMWESDGDERRFLLTLNRSRFDLFYLLPPRPDAEGQLTIKEALDQAYEQALGKVVERFVSDLKQDFRRAVEKEKLAFGPQEAKALRRQLRDLGYRLRVLELDIPSVDQFSSFADFTSSYGDALVKRFRQSQSYVTVPVGDLPGQPDDEQHGSALPLDQACDVCGNYPVFQPFAVLLEDPAWKSYVQKVVHHFRNEPERPCISCIARRILAHGAVAHETAHLRQMIAWEDEEAEKPRRLVVKRLESGPTLPPALVSRHAFESDDDFVDLGAAFARYKRNGEAVRYDSLPQLFPTVSYAADATGNVILLSLQPTQVLYGEYNYSRPLASAQNLERILQDGYQPQTDEERWQASFVLLHRWVDEQEELKSLSDNMTRSRPHLARVLGRIRHIRAFYQDLKQRLDEKPIRVLPLDVDFPTLRLMLPADDLDQALLVLDQAITESLFSATYFDDLNDRQQAHELLNMLVPDLLHGTAVLFKQKFPLYLALEAERDLFRQLQATDKRKPASDQPSRSDWYGLRLAFSDLRGTLSQAGPKLAEVTYADLGPVLNLAEEMDRRTITGRAVVINRAPVGDKGTRKALTELADALTIIRAHKQGKDREAKELLAREGKEGESKKFGPVLFLKTATRE